MFTLFATFLASSLQPVYAYRPRRLNMLKPWTLIPGPRPAHLNNRLIALPDDLLLELRLHLATRNRNRAGVCGLILNIV